MSDRVFEKMSLQECCDELGIEGTPTLEKIHAATPKYGWNWRLAYDGLIVFNPFLASAGDQVSEETLAARPSEFQIERVVVRAPTAILALARMAVGMRRIYWSNEERAAAEASSGGQSGGGSPLTQ